MTYEIIDSPISLVRWRSRIGYSVRSAARLMDVSPGLWKHWESGKIPIPPYLSAACHEAEARVPVKMPHDDPEQGLSFKISGRELALIDKWRMAHLDPIAGAPGGDGKLPPRSIVIRLALRQMFEREGIV